MRRLLSLLLIVPLVALVGCAAAVMPPVDTQATAIIKVNAIKAGETATASARPSAPTPVPPPATLVPQPTAIPLPQKHARQYTFMAVDGHGKDAAENAIAGATGGPLTMLTALAKAMTDGSIYRIEQGARVEIIGSGRIGPHIHVLEGKHAEATGTTLSTMLAAP